MQRPVFPQEKQMSDVAKVIEVVGTSEKNWTDAADRAVQAAAKTLKNISGVQVMHMTAQVRKGKIKSYKTTVKVAFGIEE